MRMAFRAWRMGWMGGVLQVMQMIVKRHFTLQLTIHQCDTFVNHESNTPWTTGSLLIDS